MANQQVDEALNDYFSDLLGGSDNDGNKVSEKTDEEVVVDPSEDKTSPEELAQQDSRDNHNADILVSHSVIKVEQRAKTGPGQANTPSNATSTASKDVNSTSEADYRPQSSIKKQNSGEPQAVIDSSSYSEHKKKLEKMLQQVTVLNTANIDSSKVSAHEVSTQEKVDTKTKLEKPQTKSVEEALTQPLSNTVPSAVTETSTDNAVESHEATDSQSFLSEALNSQWNENGRPEWAQDPFDILLVEVNGLQLAVPLVALGQIQEIEEEITPLFGQSKWFMGLQKTPTGNVKVVNTAQFIMPERYKDEHNYKFVISINGLQWGLAVDNINQPITINPEEIRWRAKRDSRPWMAGMVKDHMCVLLDIPKVGEILQDQDKNRAD